MRTSFAIACLLMAASACSDDDPPPPPPSKHAPARAPAPAADSAGQSDLGPERSEGVGARAGEAEHDPSPTGQREERPRADPDIERALDLISSSGLRFIDPPDDPDERPTEYTAEQFASMLRTKWDWLGYDLTELQPWLDEIATRSFKTNRPYRVMLADGTTSEVRPWLDAQLAKQAAP
jgi:hypothetical protein